MYVFPFLEAPKVQRLSLELCAHWIFNVFKSGQFKIITDRQFRRRNAISDTIEMWLFTRAKKKEKLRDFTLHFPANFPESLRTGKSFMAKFQIGKRPPTIILKLLSNVETGSLSHLPPHERRIEFFISHSFWAQKDRLRLILISVSFYSSERMCGNIRFAAVKLAHESFKATVIIFTRDYFLFFECLSRPGDGPCH